MATIQGGNCLSRQKVLGSYAEVAGHGGPTLLHYSW